MTAEARWTSLAEAGAAARRWLFEDAAPLWCNTDARGLFAERIDMRGRSESVARRVRVQARQIYAACELGRLGWTGDWRRPVEAAVENLLAHGRRADGFFIHTFTNEGEPLDLRADLYDHAFTLFALAHAGRALDRPELWDIAGATMDRLEAWRHPKGGFREGEIDGPPRRQNPHMHLLEAALALWQASGRARWKDLIVEITTLCGQRFIDSKTGALTEYFADDWSRLAGAEGALVEPGHCFEWAWLLGKIAQSDVPDVPLLSGRLAGFAQRFGIAGGVAINEVDLDGRLVARNARLWPQTERLKSALARRDEEEALRAVHGLRRYLQTPLAGAWYDMQMPDGTFVEQPAPASSFYHIVCGLSELLTTVDGA